MLGYNNVMYPTNVAEKIAHKFFLGKDFETTNHSDIVTSAGVI